MVEAPKDTREVSGPRAFWATFVAVTFGICAGSSLGPNPELARALGVPPETGGTPRA